MKTDPSYDPRQAQGWLSPDEPQNPKLPERVPVKLTDGAYLMWMCINGHDINDFFERAEHILKTSLDGLTITPNNRATVKALLVEHFEQIAKAAVADTPTPTKSKARK
jgi:hypothetical protein